MRMLILKLTSAVATCIHDYHCRCTVHSVALPEKAARLRLLADGKMPLPELDFAEQLKGLGLPWRAQKTSRLKRCCIARAPEVAGP